MQPSESIKDPFLSLPNDLLTCVASYIPLRPRVLVMSRLSERWHVCVFKSITRLSRRLGPRIPLERLASLPAITKFTIGEAFAEAALPTTLQSLSLDAPLTLAPGHRLESLTEVFCCPPHGAEGLVLKYAASLKALHLMDAPFEDRLARYYPRLTSLSYHALSSSAAAAKAQQTQVGTLLALHAEQLTELCISFPHAPSEVPALVGLLRPFPRLRTLDLFAWKDWMSVLAKLIPRDCKVSYSMREDDITEEVCPYLSDIVAFEEVPHDMLIRCTNLTDLTVAYDSVDALPASLRRLSLRDCPILLAQDWSHLRSLRRLKAARLPPSLCTVHLRKLRLDWQPYARSQRGLLALTEVIDACPRLKKLGSTPLLPCDLNVEQLAQLARFAEARGVTVLSVRLAFWVVRHVRAAKALVSPLAWIEVRFHDKSEA